jgi:hypothetical protein
MDLHTGSARSAGPAIALMAAEVAEDTAEIAGIAEDIGRHDCCHMRHTADSAAASSASPAGSAAAGSADSAGSAAADSADSEAEAAAAGSAAAPACCHWVRSYRLLTFNCIIGRIIYVRHLA